MSTPVVVDLDGVCVATISAHALQECSCLRMWFCSCYPAHSLTHQVLHLSCAGDSITVAPAQTITDKEYQRLRDAAVAIIREMGVECGGSNVQVRTRCLPVMCNHVVSGMRLSVCMWCQVCGCLCACVHPCEHIIAINRYSIRQFRN